jgi:hypothetical protein
VNSWIDASMPARPMNDETRCTGSGHTVANL